MGMNLTEVMRLAEPRNNLISYSLLREELGLKSHQIDHLRTNTAVTLLYPNVLLIGTSSPSVEQRLLGASLAYPDGAVGFSSASAVFGLRRARKDQLEFVVLKGRRPHLPGFRVHSTSRLDEVDVLDVNDGLRVTRPARTIADMAGVLDDFGIRSMIEDALNHELCTTEQLADAAERLAVRGRPGGRRFLEAVLARDPLGRPAQSEQEIVLADALAERGITTLRQHRVVLATGRETFFDLYIEDSRLDIELDHSHWHAGAVEVQRDKSRDLYVRLLGIDPVRVTDDDIRLRLRMTVAMICRLHEQRLDLLQRRTS